MKKTSTLIKNADVVVTMDAHRAELKGASILIENGAIEAGSDVITPFTDKEGESKEFNVRYGDFIGAIENLSCNCYPEDAFN